MRLRGGKAHPRGRGLVARGLTWRARAQVEAAVACIQAKIHQACNTWKQDEWWQQAQTHRRKAKLTRSVAYTALPSVVTWWGAKLRGRK